MLDCQEFFSSLLKRVPWSRFSESTVWRLFDRRGITFKKNRSRQRATAA